MNMVDTILFTADFIVLANIIIRNILYARQSDEISYSMSTWRRNLVIQQVEKREVSTSLGESWHCTCRGDSSNTIVRKFLLYRDGRTTNTSFDQAERH